MKLNYYEVEPEQSTFYTVAVDVTHRCNMECANCYSPLRDIPDIEIQELKEFFSRLGRRTELRLTGGEPTLRKDLPEIISSIVENGHRAALMTNGLKLADREYCEQLKSAGLKFVCLSLNGADDDDVYEVLDNRRCAKLKMSALQNIIDLGFFVNINCILIKGLNEHVPEKLAQVLKANKVHGTLRFRNIGKMGRYMNRENMSFNDMVNLLSNAFDKTPEYIKSYNQVNGYEEIHNVLFPLDEKRRLSTTWIKITDWRPSEDAIPDPGSIRRGRMTKNFKVAPFFEHSKIHAY